MPVESSPLLCSCVSLCTTSKFPDITIFQPDWASSDHSFSDRPLATYRLALSYDGSLVCFHDITLLHMITKEAAQLCWGTKWKMPAGTSKTLNITQAQSRGSCFTTAARVIRWEAGLDVLLAPLFRLSCARPRDWSDWVAETSERRCRVPAHMQAICWVGGQL